MSGKPSLPPLPPLSRQALDEVERIEEDVQDLLTNCGDNPEKALRILRTAVVESLNAQTDYYFSLTTFYPVWLIELIKRAVDSLIGLCPPFTSGGQFRSELFITAIHHLAQRPGATKNKAAIATLPKPDGSDRRALRDSYLANFAGEKIKIRDLCWAASQHYREWRRWLKGELKDGSTPDLQFRRLLTSGKRPEEFKIKSRPPGWE